MYSPKIRDDLIPRIYRAAKGAKVPMTRWVSEVLERALCDPVGHETATSEEQPHQGKKEESNNDDQGKQRQRGTVCHLPNR